MGRGKRRGGKREGGGGGGGMRDGVLISVVSHKCLNRHLQNTLVNRHLQNTLVSFRNQSGAFVMLYTCTSYLRISASSFFILLTMGGPSYAKAV